MNLITTADFRRLNAAFAKEINALVAKWNRDNSGNLWADDARAVAQSALVNLAQTGALTPDEDGEFSAQQRMQAKGAMRHAVHAQLVPLSKPLTASVNTLAAYRKARKDFEAARPEDDFAEVSVETIMRTLRCTRCFALRAQSSAQRRANIDNPDSPAAHLTDDSLGHPADKLIAEERARAARAALNAIDPAKRELLGRLYGFDARTENTITELAAERRITRQAMTEQVERVFTRLRPTLADYAYAA